MDSDKSQNTQEQPEQQKSGVQKIVDNAKAFTAAKANPGPAVPKDFNVAEEGTKEQRRAKAQELNK